MTLYKNKYRVESARLQNWDYGWNGKYFITIVTKDREYFFGEIDNSKKLHLSEIGIYAEKYWYEIPKHFPFIILDKFIVMPNHIHGIIIIEKKRNGGGDNRDERRDKACLVSTTPQPSLSPGKKRFRNPGKNNISTIVGSYKSAVSRKGHLIEPDFDWQSRFHDHIIRDDMELKKIQNYIVNNPKNWVDDIFHNR